MDTACKKGEELPQGCRSGKAGETRPPLHNAVRLKRKKRERSANIE